MLRLDLFFGALAKPLLARAGLKVVFRIRGGFDLKSFGPISGSDRDVVDSVVYEQPHAPKYNALLATELASVDVRLATRSRKTTHKLLTDSRPAAANP